MAIMDWLQPSREPKDTIHQEIRDYPNLVLRVFLQNKYKNNYDYNISSDYKLACHCIYIDDFLVIERNISGNISVDLVWEVTIGHI